MRRFTNIGPMRIQHQCRPKKHFPFEQRMAILEPFATETRSAPSLCTEKENCHARKHYRLYDFGKYIYHG